MYVQSDCTLTQFTRTGSVALLSRAYFFEISSTQNSLYISVQTSRKEKSLHGRLDSVKRTTQASTQVFLSPLTFLLPRRFCFRLSFSYTARDPANADRSTAMAKHPFLSLSLCLLSPDFSYGASSSLRNPRASLAVR